MSSWFSGITNYFSKSQPYPTLTNVCHTLEKSNEKANIEFEELKVDTKRVSDVEKLKKKYLSVCDELKELIEEGTSKRTPPQPIPSTTTTQSGGRKKTIKRRNSKSKSKSKRKHH
jgi:hypothetical protein